ncbi:hypothetical protein F2Q68_00011023 [Brassica cretica]|uniref:Ribosomal protein L19e C-terminal domain-containing protein n=1 Tax=Brassica cretica TaxID=69181 RepID=A0A8S9KXT4_BRACR|nr:hypothetical protein F2Q68_00011023 [Brassica cretica]
MISTALASRSDSVCVRVDTGRGTTFGVLEISTWFIHVFAANNQIDKHMYHDMYKKVKGGVFKNKRMLMESIHKSKVEQAREKTFSDQFEAKRVKNKARKGRKFARKEERLARRAGGGEIDVVS